MENLLTYVSNFNGIILEGARSTDPFEVEGIVQRAGALNQNGRYYDKAILEREVTRYIQEFVNSGNAYGELDHPESTVVSLQNASHVVKSLWWEGDNLFGRLQLLNTPAGNIVKEIIRGGHTIGISSRGTGSVTTTNEGHLEVQPDFELVCWDFVSNPSTQGAFMKSSQPLSEAVQKRNSSYLKINNIINDILRS
jgi:hypothetical protein